MSGLSVTGAAVTAVAGDGAAAIGGGSGSTGSDPAVSIEDGDVTLAGGAAATFTIFENAATSGGTSTVRVAADGTLTVPTGETLRNTGDLVVDGTLTGSGTIENPGGTIRRGAAGVIDDGALTVTGRNHAVSFDAAGGTTTAPAVQHVYADSFASGGLDLAGYAGTSGDRSLVGWSGGTIAHVSSSDLLAPLSAGGGESDPVALTAAYEVPIAFSSRALPNAATGRPYAAPAPVTGGATTFSVAPDPSSGLPADTIPGFPSGLAIDEATGAITGQPATGGHYSFLLTASSPHQRRSQAVSLDVAGAPVIATAALPGAAVGTAYAAPVLATSERGAIAYALVAGTLPSGLHLDPVTGLIAGTPTAAGSAAFTITATNAFGSTDRALAMSVSASASAPIPSGASGSGGGTNGTGGATGIDGTGGAGGGSGAAATGSTPPGGSPASGSAATGTLISAPRLPILGTTTVKLGHALALSVAASSTVPVAYAVRAKDLPAGVALDRSTGLLYGSPRASGRFTLHVTATSGAGSSARTYTVLVPAITRLVTGSTSAVTPKSGGSVRVTVRGLQAGERWRIALNGRQVQTGVARFGGSVQRSVRLPSRTRDTTHTIRVSGSRRITDPSTTATHQLTVTAVLAKKALRVTRSGRTLTVRDLAAKERVTIRRGSSAVATGRADAHGVFVTRTTKYGKYSVTGSSNGRKGSVVVRQAALRR
ncbi:putative Ig domain-containing protein [Amnibacterium kyonggiense]